MIKVKKIKPMFNNLITTMDKYEEDQTVGSIIDVTKKQGTLKEFQKVLAIGSMVRDMKEGDLVCINPNRFRVPKHNNTSVKEGIMGDQLTMEYKFDIVEMDGKQCLLLQDRDIDFIIEEYEDNPDPKPSGLIMPEEKKIIC